MSSRMGWKGWVCAVGALTLSGSAAMAADSTGPHGRRAFTGELPPYALSYTDFTVQLRPDVSTVVAGTWFTCTSAPVCAPVPREHRTVVAIPGLSHTAVTYAPLAEQLCGALRDGIATSILAIDLPGHGLSADPRGLSFSDMSQEDYAVAVEGVLSQLSAHHARPVAAIGHSMGGLVLQRVQARLLGAGSNLHRAYGISSAALMAPVPVAEVAWPFADSGAADPVLASFVVNDPVRGTVARIPAAAWPSLFFTNLSGAVVPGTPAPADLDARGYTADEPLVAGLQLVGSGGFSRPSAPAGAFAPAQGTQTTVITLSEDGFYTAGEHEALYQYLTADTTNAGLTRLNMPDAVHDLHVAQPAIVAPYVLNAVLPQPSTPVECHGR
jgi:pimeloyl-ACP methyl ester carboxylesterase